MCKQSLDQQEKHHAEVTFTVTELFSSKSSQGKKPTDPMFVSELTFRQWISQAFPYELSNVTDCSLQQDGHTGGTEDSE